MAAAEGCRWELQCIDYPYLFAEFVFGVSALSQIVNDEGNQWLFYLDVAALGTTACTHLYTKWRWQVVHLAGETNSVAEAMRRDADALDGQMEAMERGTLALQSREAKVQETTEGIHLQGEQLQSQLQALLGEVADAKALYMEAKNENASLLASLTAATSAQGKLLAALKKYETDNNELTEELSGLTSHLSALEEKFSGNAALATTETKEEKEEKEGEYETLLRRIDAATADWERKSYAAHL